MVVLFLLFTETPTLFYSSYINFVDTETSWETWTSRKTLSTVGNFLRQCSPWVPGPQLTGARNSSWTIAESTAGIQVSMSITWYVERWDSSWVTWHMLLVPTAPTKAHLSLNRCQILIVEGGIGVRDYCFAVFLMSFPV